MRIVAIGGGEIGRPGHPVGLTEIDAEVVRLTGKRRPLVAFFPTATVDDRGYMTLMNEHYGGRLGCRVEAVTLFDRTRTAADIARSISAADIVYVGGGNTLRMMKLWRRRGVDRMLMDAAADGTVLAGISAGAICWSAAGVSDSRSFTAGDADWPYIAVRGLGLVDVLLCPHHDADPRRRDALRRLARRDRRVGLGLDDCAALEIVDDRYRILSCREGSTAHRVHHTTEVELAADGQFRPLTELWAAPARR